MRMEITKTKIFSAKLSRSYRIVVAADLHNREPKGIIEEIRKLSPDMILVPGDLCHNLDKPHYHRDSKNGFLFLERASEIADVYYSVGNHEKAVSKSTVRRIAKTGAILLDNKTVICGELAIGGLSSVSYNGRLRETPPPDLEYLKKFDSNHAFKLLLSHHPEYYPRYIRETDIDLTVSGHAHGGQWRIFGRGVFAPGQGLFPKYTSGLFENRLYVSRGLTNTCHPIPRIFNKTELAVIELVTEEGK